MASAKPKQKTPTTQQKLCIDLPGEQVQCWRSSENVQVILRKHRDVIFDLRLTQNRTYTVESAGSDFYNADEKKLIRGKGEGRVSFADGDKLHLWIARDFKGEFVLKSAGKIVLKFDPGKLDAQQYNDDPKTKPVPIIITLGSPSQSSEQRMKNTINELKTLQARASLKNMEPMAAPIDEVCNLVVL